MTQDEMMGHLDALTEAPMPEIVAISSCLCGMLRSLDAQSYNALLGLVNVCQAISQVELKRCKAKLILGGYTPVGEGWPERCQFKPQHLSR